jgi:hypothetical protein
MSEPPRRRRFEVWKDRLQSTPIYQWGNACFWKTCSTARTVLWTLSTAALLLLLPLAIEATIDGEAKAMEISRQIGGGGLNPEVQYRPY